MNNFAYLSPTKVIFGKDVENKVGEELKNWGATKIMIQYGGQSARKSGLLDRVEASLKDAGLSYVTMGGVVPNPRVSFVREAIKICKKEKVDFLLAVGGGSVIDSCKATGYGVLYDGDVWDIYDGKYRPAETLPTANIPTIAAAGSETSNSSVITNEDGWLKKGHTNDVCRPKFTMMNPSLTFTLPPYQTSCGIVDIMMHTMDRYFAPKTSCELTDAIAEGLLRVVIKNGKAVLNDPANYDIRAEIMWAGSLSHNGLTGLGRAMDFSVHALEHELSAKWDVAHGAGLAAMWASWARFAYKTDVMRFVRFANQVWGIELDTDNPEKTALAGIEATERFFSSIHMPISIGELIGREPTEEEIEDLAVRCTFYGKRKVGAFLSMGRDELKKIYTMAK